MAGYRVLYGGLVVYEAGSDSRYIHDATLDMRVDAVSQFTFTILPTHPLRNAFTIRSFESPVEVYFDSQLLFRGFIVRMSENMNTELIITCASDLQMLADVHMRADRIWGSRRDDYYNAPQLFDYVIRNYNSKVEASRRFTIGHTISANAAGYYDYDAERIIVAVASTSPVPALELLKKSILDPYACMLKVWYSGGTRYIGLYSSAPDTSGQRIEFGENMLDFAVEYDTEDLYNGCIPLGASRRTYRLENAPEVFTSQQAYIGDFFIHLSRHRDRETVIEAKKGDIIVIGDGEYQIAEDVDIDYDTYVKIEGGLYEPLAPDTLGHYVERGTDYTSATLTLDGFPEGIYDGYVKAGQYVYHQDSVNHYGLKTFTFTDSDIMTQRSLLRRAMAEISGKISPTLTLSITGVDMALYMPGYVHLVAGQKVRVVSVPHNFDQTMQVTKAVLNLSDPGRTKYIIGTIPKTATMRTRMARFETQDVKDMLMYDMNNVISGADIMRLS
jgi:hypothetical protein